MININIMKNIKTQTKKTFETTKKKSKTKSGKKPIKAIANVSGPRVQGNIIFEEDPINSQVKINIELTGLSPGLHGFHIHEAGNIENQCKGCCAHFNPFGTVHGGPNDLVRHVGDLGNITADKNGRVSEIIYDKMIKLRGNRANIIGRSVVVHTDEDNLGKPGDPESLLTGRSGGREACGVIGYAEAYYF